MSWSFIILASSSCHDLHQQCCSQLAYIATLGSITLKDEEDRNDELKEVSEVTHGLYRQLLGAVAWTMLTRADLAIYVQALQRRCAKPRVVDVRRLNLVVRYLKRHLIGIRYPPVPQPWRLAGISDSAF